ncbi:hydroxyisourate hydrolase [Nakamurella sp.]|uniref:hydroxyisourate hydrolase n=1 Tax=Nakamurella sp. TaxID=1869182 RepID=UPI0037850E0B
MSLSTHVLDAGLGRPAEGVPIQLTRSDDQAAAAIPLFTAVTDSDGRHRHQSAGKDVPLAAGIYELTFDTGAYFTASGQTGFYPKVTVTFEITDVTAHHHVPLLLSPFAFSTYRGS